MSLSLGRPVRCRNSLIVPAVRERFLAAQAKAIMSLHTCYQTRYLTAEGQTQNGNLPYGVTGLWWGNSSKSTAYLAALWFFTATLPSVIWASFLCEGLIGGTGRPLTIHKSELRMPTTLCMDGWFSAQSSLVKTDPSFIPPQSDTLCNVACFLYYVRWHRFG